MVSRCVPGASTTLSKWVHDSSMTPLIIVGDPVVSAPGTARGGRETGDGAQAQLLPHSDARAPANAARAFAASKLPAAPPPAAPAETLAAEAAEAKPQEPANAAQEARALKRETHTVWLLLFCFFVLWWSFCCCCCCCSRVFVVFLFPFSGPGLGRVVKLSIRPRPLAGSLDLFFNFGVDLNPGNI